jgi:hypothetical protein
MQYKVKRLAVVLLVAAFSLGSAAGQNPPLTIANDLFPGGIVREEYLQALRFSGGYQSDLTPKPQFTVEAGVLPSGLASVTLQRRIRPGRNADGGGHVSVHPESCRYVRRLRQQGFLDYGAEASANGPRLPDRWRSWS